MAVYKGGWRFIGVVVVYEVRVPKKGTLSTVSGYEVRVPSRLERGVFVTHPFYKKLHRGF